MQEGRAVFRADDTGAALEIKAQTIPQPPGPDLPPVPPGPDMPPPAPGPDVPTPFPPEVPTPGGPTLPPGR